MRNCAPGNDGAYNTRFAPGSRRNAAVAAQPLGDRIGIDFGMMPMGGDKLMLADKVPFELDLQFLEPKAG